METKMETTKLKPLTEEMVRDLLEPVIGLERAKIPGCDQEWYWNQSPVITVPEGYEVPELEEGVPESGDDWTVIVRGSDLETWARPVKVEGRRVWFEVEDPWLCYD